MKNNRLVIFGAGGHGKVIADIALKNGYADICFLDDHSTGAVMGLPVVGTCEDALKMDDGNTDFIIGIGSNATRKIIAKKYAVNFVTLVHPSAQIGTDVSIGKGSVVMANAVVNVCSTIGEHCIINTGAIVEHDNIMKDYVHISPGSALGGTVCVGEGTHIGIGAIIKNNIDICNDVVVGAGAVVVKHIKNSGVYIGVPARKMK